MANTERTEIPSDKRSEITKTAMLVGALLLVIGAAIGWFARPQSPVLPQSVLQLPHTGFVMTQAPGDPPVTVSDGSLHAHSKYDWTADNDTDPTITPNPASTASGYTPGYSTTCGMTALDPITGKPNPVSGVLWTDDEMTTDLSPGTTGITVTIVHDPNGLDAPDSTGHDAEVIITANPGTAPTIATNRGSFHAPEGSNPGQQEEARYNRRHKRPGNVSEIIVKRGATTIRDWTPVNTWDPHFTIGFCYQ